MQKLTIGMAIFAYVALVLGPYFHILDKLRGYLHEHKY
jgi:hypothetical protein